MATKLNSQRGRPKKRGPGSEYEPRSYWFGELFIDQGWTWGTEFVEVEPADGRSCWQARPLCLGREDDIVPILKGQKPLPADLHPRQRALLASILEADEHGELEVIPRATRIQRSGYARAIRHRQKDARRLKAREGLSLRKAHR